MNRRSFFRGLAALFAAPAVAKAVVDDPAPLPSSGRVEVLGCGSQMRVVGPMVAGPWTETRNDDHIAVYQACVDAGILPDYTAEEKAAIARHKQDHLRYLNQCQR